MTFYNRGAELEELRTAHESLDHDFYRLNRPSASGRDSEGEGRRKIY